MNITVIATAFSNGEFEKVYPFIADNVEWVVVGDETFKGKYAVVSNCEQVSKYFKSVTANFNTKNVITQKNMVIINGTAEFLRDNICVSFVDACDIYEFNEQLKLQHITSYCISQNLKVTI